MLLLLFLKKSFFNMNIVWQDVPPVWEHSKVFYQCVANDIPVSPAMVLFQVIHAPMAIFYGGTFGCNQYKNISIYYSSD